MLLVLSFEGIFKIFKAKYSDAACGEAWFANPYIIFAVDPTILRVLLLQLCVHLVGLVHHIQVGNLPTSEVQNFNIGFLIRHVLKLK